MLAVGSNRRRSLKESVKQLEAHIQHANTLALSLPKEGACVQMRLGFAPAFLLCIFSWVDCSLAGSLGLLHVLIYKVLKDGTTTMSTHERRASLREFYGYILPSLQILDGGISNKEMIVQRAICKDKYKRKPQDEDKHRTQVDIERDQECGICLETINKVVLPGCCHALCIKCYSDWRARSASCPFCRKSLKHVNSRDLWVLMDYSDVDGAETFTRDNHRRLLLYIEKLPLSINNNPYDSRRKGYQFIDE